LAGEFYGAVARSAAAHAHENGLYRHEPPRICLTLRSRINGQGTTRAM
jgi:hypothetical protein